MSRDNLLEDFDKFVKGQSVSAVVVMMLYEEFPGQPSRDIALYSTKKVLQEKVTLIKKSHTIQVAVQYDNTINCH